jgi:HEAT repeat protein
MMSLDRRAGMSMTPKADGDQARVPGTSGDRGGAAGKRRAVGVGALTALVAGCAVILGVGRVSWDEDHPLETAARGLDSAEPSRRTEAVQEVSDLGFRNPGASIRLLVPSLKDRDAGVRKAAAESLGLLSSNAIGVGTDTDEVRAVTAVLLELTKDPDDRVRGAVTTSLAVIVSAKSWPVGRSMNPTRQASALDIDVDAVAAALTAALDGPDEPVRQAALIGLGAVAARVSGGPPPALIKALDDESAANRSAAAAALGNYRQGLDPAIPPLLRHLEDGEQMVRQACVEAIGKIPPSSASSAIAPAVIAALRTPDRPDRASLATLLGRVKPDPRAAVPVLLAMLREPAAPGGGPVGVMRNAVDPSMSSPADAAAQALGEVAPGTPHAAEVMAALLEIVRSGPPQLRGSAADALGAFGPAAVSAVPILLGLLKDARSADALTPAGSAAIRALGKIAPGTPAADEAMAAVIEALRAPWVWTRWQALETLPAFGPRAAAALPVIRELKDKDAAPDVRQAASQALEKIKP